MRFVIFDQPGDERFFGIPSDCNVIWVSGCGGGGGGVTATSVNGGAGGGPAPTFLRVPLSVRPNGVLTIHVGEAGTSVDISAQSERVTTISGDALLSPLVGACYLPMFSMGFGADGGHGGNTNIYCTTTNSLSTSAMTSTINLGGVWDYSTKTFPEFLMPPVIKPDAQTIPPANPYSLSTVGQRTFMDRGMGTESASDPTYGSGTGGGGGIFGKGGSGGVYAGAPGNGGNGAGYGSGGGGGSGGPNPYGQGGLGGSGLVVIEY